GAIVGQVPRQTFSLWNTYQLHPRVGAGVGLIHRSDMFATISDTVTLPGYVRADAAAFVTLRKDLRLQVNLENAFDKQYFVNADRNTNISPGIPRSAGPEGPGATTQRQMRSYLQGRAFGALLLVEGRPVF